MTTLEDIKKMSILKVNKRGTSFNVDPTLHHAFWHSVIENRWEKHIFKVLNIFLDKDHSYIDIGAWIGSTLLYGGTLAKTSYGIEPDHVAFKKLQKNVNLNPGLNIKLWRGGIFDQNEKDVPFGLGLHSHQIGDSASSIYVHTEIKDMIETMKLDTFISLNNINDVGLIKIDTEGAEMKIISSSKDYILKNKPTLYVSIHAEIIKKFKLEHKLIDEAFEVLSQYKYKFVVDTNGKNYGDKVGIHFIREAMKQNTTCDFVFTDKDIQI